MFKKFVWMTVLILFVFIPQPGFCGGMPLKVEIVDFVIEGNDQYTVQFLIKDSLNKSPYPVGSAIIVHMQNGVSESFKKVMNKDLYLKSINELLVNYKDRREFDIAVAFSESISGKPNEYDCRGFFMGKGFDRNKMETLTFLP